MECAKLMRTRMRIIRDELAWEVGGRLNPGVRGDRPYRQSGHGISRTLIGTGQSSAFTNVYHIFYYPFMTLSINNLR
jgi:hypothetical protein